MAAMAKSNDGRAAVEEGDPALEDRDFDEPGSESAPAGGRRQPGRPGGKLAAPFEAFGLKVQRSRAGRLTIGVEIELGPDGTMPEPPVAKAPAEEAAKPAAKPLRLSQKGAQLIARFEGFRPKLYNDPAGHCTIGIGHLVHRGRCTGREKPEFKRGITRAQAYALLQKDARTAEKAVRRLRVPLNQQQFDALVSFTYNVGTAWTRKSRLRTALLQRRYKDVPRAMSRWVYAGKKRLPGLVKRRRAEGRLFRSRKYT